MAVIDNLSVLRLASFAAATIVTLLAAIALAQSGSPNPKEPMDSILVFGDGFLFSLQEPEGWRCVCDEAATEYQANAVVFPSSAQSRARHVAIRIRVNQKTDENTAEDLNSDMREYKRKYPTVQFAALDVAHPEYRTHAKLFLFPKDFYDYVAYVNPGPDSWFTLSIAMSKEKVPATQGELAAYAKVLKSLRAFTTKSSRAH